MCGVGCDFADGIDNQLLHSDSASRRLGICGCMVPFPDGVRITAAKGVYRCLYGLSGNSCAFAFLLDHNSLCGDVHDVALLYFLCYSDAVFPNVSWDNKAA